ncbi:MAG TPA: YbhB/YbcL family Raf kinase inhibitor-like protein, partial [Bdellovibrionales bacterium]|nr:YbhB/YbcL family Raf kinase inhibitor-like protein [Bdellovibrionales bacterium]
MSQFLLSTDAIFNNGEFDPRYTCDLDNSSPEIRWEGEPAGTQAFALIVDDVGRSLSDAAESGFTHWLIYM